LLDEYGEVLGNRYLKSVESVESGTKCQLPNYLIEVYEPRNQPNETKLSSKDALNQTGPRDQKNTSDKMSEKSRSPKFVSPFKFQVIFLQTYTKIIVFSCLPLAIYSDPFVSTICRCPEE